MFSISDSSARKNELFPELKALSTSSLSRKCLPLHPKFSFLCSLHCPDAEPIKKGKKIVFFSLWSSVLSHQHSISSSIWGVIAWYPHISRRLAWAQAAILTALPSQINHTQNILFAVSSSSQELYDCLFCLRAAHAYHILAKLLQNIS